MNFFRSIREAKPVYEGADCGYRITAPALFCNESYRQKRHINGNPSAMKIVSRAHFRHRTPRAI
jgi:hypothetical protein